MASPSGGGAGSLIDIVNIGRLKVAHSWHQDSGLEAMTVMLGFPKENHYSGTGVFSHGVKLSHRLKDQVPGGGQVLDHGAVWVSLGEGVIFHLVILFTGDPV